MNVCPRCRSYTTPGYIVCQNCGADVPKSGDGATYGRGFIELAKTRFGMRIIVMLVVLIGFGIWSLVTGR
jgi:hypothetical protein